MRIEAYIHAGRDGGMDCEVMEAGWGRTLSFIYQDDIKDCLEEASRVLYERDYDVRTSWMYDHQSGVFFCLVSEAVQGEVL